MKVLLVNGSAKKEGPCGEKLQRAAECLRAAGYKTELFWPVKTEGLLCSGCGACRGAGMCVADPRGGAFLRAAAQSDGFVIAAPVGLLGLGTDLLNLLKRAAELAARSKNDPFAGKPAALLLTGRRSGKAAAELRALTEALGLREGDDGELAAALRALSEEEAMV